MPKASQHRAAIIETAMRLFRRQGYAATGLQQIVIESGAPKGSLYHYFPGGKEDLAVATVQKSAELMNQMLSEHAENSDSPEQFVEAYCQTMANWMAESDFQSGSPITTTMLETVPTSKDLTRAGQEAMDLWTETIASVFHKSGAQIETARLHARQLIGSIEGALILTRIYQTTDPLLDVAKTFKRP